MCRLSAWLLAAVPLLAGAETLYVTDELRLSLYVAPDGKSEVVKLLRSGDPLEVLEEQGAFVRVRTTEGEEGWAKRGFMESDKPATLLLAESERARERLAAELERLRAADDGSLERRLAELETALAAAETELTALRGERDEARERVQDLERALDPAPEVFWWRIGIAAAAVLLLLAAGFVAGHKLMERRVRRRFGGLKVW